jgi:hypothetical protein
VWLQRDLRGNNTVRETGVPLKRCRWAAARVLLSVGIERINSMSVVRILGFSTLSCGCVVGRYRDIASTREVVYVEEKGVSCESHAHRRNHTVSAERERFAAVSLTTLTARAS